jgi:hypothetical protein
MGQAASMRLAAEIDKNIYATVAAQASIFVKKTGAIAWPDFATAEALMLSRGITSTMKKAFLNPFDYSVIAQDLGNKAYMGDWSKSAYERSQVPDIAGFRTFRTDNLANVTVTGTVSGTTIKGAQSHTVTAMTGDVPTDNRRMTLLVQGANVANIKAGDAFTITGVNAVHNIDKSDTGQLMTFRVISSTASSSDRNLVITPAIVATGPYQNVTGVAADTAPLVFLNTATAAMNPFWYKDAIEIYERIAAKSIDYNLLNDWSSFTVLVLPISVCLNVFTQRLDNWIPAFANRKATKLFRKDFWILFQHVFFKFVMSHIYFSFYFKPKASFS